VNGRRRPDREEPGRLADLRRRTGASWSGRPKFIRNLCGRQARDRNSPVRAPQLLATAGYCTPAPMGAWIDRVDWSGAPGLSPL
jgi:hypothetical protein